MGRHAAAVIRAIVSPSHSTAPTQRRYDRNMTAIRRAIGASGAVTVRPHRAAAALVLAASASLPVPATALQPLVTDDTETQGSGGNQLELTLDRERVRSAEGRSSLRAATVVYTRGLTDDLDAFVEASHVRLRSSFGEEGGRGAGNPVLGLKWRFWEAESGRVSLGVKPEIRFGLSRDSERRGLAEDGTGYAATLILSQETRFGAVHANLSAERSAFEIGENRAANRRMLYRASVAPVVALTPGWKAAVDLGITTNPDRGRRARMGYVELGAIWSPSDDLELALGWIRPLGDGEPSSHTWTAGLTWKF
jgi:hypothetical protein